MSDKKKEQEIDTDSSKKHARGSKKIHNEKDDSTEDGFKSNKTKK